MKKTILLIFLFSAFMANAQETGTLKLELAPDFAQYRIDNQVYEYKKTRTLQLRPGTYTIEVWAPKLTLVKDTISIESGKTTNYIRGLKTLSERFAQYKKDIDIYEKYARNAKFQRIASVTTIVGGAILVFGKSPSLFTLDRDLKKLNKRYSSQTIDAPELEEIKNSFELKLEEREPLFEKHKRKVTVGTPIFAGITALIVYYNVRLLKKEQLRKPTYEEINPFTYIQKNIQPGFSYSQDNIAFSLSLNF